MSQREQVSFKTALGEARRMALEIGGEDIEIAEKTTRWLTNRTEQTLVWLMYVISYGEGWTIGRLADAGFDLTILKALQVMEMRDEEDLIDYIYRLKENVQAENAFAAQATIRLFQKMEQSEIDLTCAGDDMVSVLVISILNGYKFDAREAYRKYKWQTRN